MRHRPFVRPNGDLFHTAAARPAFVGRIWNYRLSGLSVASVTVQRQASGMEALLPVSRCKTPATRRCEPAPIAAQHRTQSPRASAGPAGVT